MTARPLGRSVFCVLVLTLGVARAPASAGDANDPAAKVNGVVITQGMVRELVKSVIAASPAPPDSDELDQLFSAALDSLIELELLHQEAAARRIKVSPKEIDAEIQKTRARFRDAEQFAAALRQTGMSEQQLREDTKKTLLADRLLAQVVGRDVKVKDADARAFYDRNRKEFEHPEQVRVRNLLLRAPPAGAERESVRRKIEQLRAQIAKGTSFSTVARQHSEDGESAPNGGDLGFVARGKLPAAVEEAAFSLPKGALSPVIETTTGYYLVQVVEHQKPGVTAFADVKEAIVRTLVTEEIARRRAAFVEELKKKAKVEVVRG